METKTGIKQSDFMREHGLKPENMKAIRDKHVPRDQWWKDGVVVYWSEDAARIVKAALSIKESAPQPAKATGGTIQVRVNRAARNPSFVYGDLNGFRIPIECPRNLSNRLVGKNIQVAVLEKDGQAFYQYQP